jgi:hypothetical protein
MAVDNGQTSNTKEMYKFTQEWFKLFLGQSKNKYLGPSLRGVWN